MIEKMGKRHWDAKNVGAMIVDGYAKGLDTF